MAAAPADKLYRVAISSGRTARIERQRAIKLGDNVEVKGQQNFRCSPRPAASAAKTPSCRPAPCTGSSTAATARSRWPRPRAFSVPTCRGGVQKASRNDRNLIWMDAPTARYSAILDYGCRKAPTMGNVARVRPGRLGDGTVQRHGRAKYPLAPATPGCRLPRLHSRRWRSDRRLVADRSVGLLSGRTRIAGEPGGRAFDGARDAVGRCTATRRGPRIRPRQGGVFLGRGRGRPDRDRRGVDRGRGSGPPAASPARSSRSGSASACRWSRRWSTSASHWCCCERRANTVSVTLRANAHHLLTDVWTLPALCWRACCWSWPPAGTGSDPLVALSVAANIVWTGWRSSLIRWTG